MSLRRCQRGLTLLEMTVTLVIVALVAGLMSEGMYQLGRIEQRLGSGQLQAQLARLRLVWLQQALEGLLPEQPNSPDQFLGGPRQLQGMSTMLPLPEYQGPVHFGLALIYRADLGRTELSMDLSASAERMGSVVLVDWHGDEGAFRYMDPAGTWLSDWPPMGVQPAPALPRAVAVRRGDSLLVVAVPQATAQALGRRTDIEKLP